jgi:hypothetical protein
MWEVVATAAGILLVNIGGWLVFIGVVKTWIPIFDERQKKTDARVEALAVRVSAFEQLCAATHGRKVEG